MEATTTATTPSVNDKGTHHEGPIDPGLYCRQLERLLMGAAAELGQRGNLAQVVASIERGGAGGSLDPDGSMVERLNMSPHAIRQLRDLAQRWGALERKHQATALAQYVGRSRCHPTIREHFGEGQGGLASVVLYRWQLKQSKGRERTAKTANIPQALERLHAELLPLEQLLIELRNTDRRPVLLSPETRPTNPKPPLVLRRRYLEEARRPYLEDLRHWHAQQAVLRFLSAWRLISVDERIADVDAAVEPLRAQQTLLCCGQADLAAALTAKGEPIDDELGLAKACRGELSRQTKDAMSAAAMVDVRALHRAWYATARRAAVAWVEDEDATA